MSVTRYPLAWPTGYQRTTSRSNAQFGTIKNAGASQWKNRQRLTIAEAVKRLQSALDGFNSRTHYDRCHVPDAILSTNLRTRLDGLPSSGQPEPADPGAAIYFRLDGKDKVMCCDKWSRVADNIAGIAATLDALRSIERWGVSECNRAFTGFEALPAPGDVQARTCWTVLGIPPTRDPAVIDAAWRDRAKVCHPDLPGGSHEAMSELNTARDQAHTAI
jgi:hypothetical protein